MSLSNSGTSEGAQARGMQEIMAYLSPSVIPSLLLRVVGTLRGTTTFLPASPEKGPPPTLPSAHSQGLDSELTMKYL